MNTGELIAIGIFGIPIVFIVCATITDLANILMRSRKSITILSKCKIYEKEIEGLGKVTVIEGE